ncbi:MAG: twin-arginine translocation signal domain-containing protein, partial [Rhodothermales bacterium]|nr:twin-arginine translocation signal domain-containing protein [Rhodothermales bacterium]
MPHDHDPSARPGRCLHDGHAHDADHARWSRRDFLARMGLASAGLAFAVGGQPVSAFGRAPALRALGEIGTDRVLVLLQLRGGNDGLNTVVPVGNDVYYRMRPTIAIRPEDALALDAETGLHPAMQGLAPLWGGGRMAV